MAAAPTGERRRDKNIARRPATLLLGATPRRPTTQPGLQPPNSQQPSQQLKRMAERATSGIRQHGLLLLLLVLPALVLAHDPRNPPPTPLHSSQLQLTPRFLFACSGRRSFHSQLRPQEKLGRHGLGCLGFGVRVGSGDDRGTLLLGRPALATQYHVTALALQSPPSSLMRDISIRSTI